MLVHLSPTWMIICTTRLPLQIRFSINLRLQNLDILLITEPDV